MRCARQRLSDQTCCFTNALDIWGDGSAVNEELSHKGTYADKLHHVWDISRQSYGYCLSHEAMCPIGKSRCRVQGPPCPDWSRAAAGKRLREDGKRLPTLLAAGARADHTQSAATGVENVPGLPIWIIEDAYGPRFSWIQTYMMPSFVGFDFIARKRQGL